MLQTTSDFFQLSSGHNKLSRKKNLGKKSSVKDVKYLEVKKV